MKRAMIAIGVGACAMGAHAGVEFSSGLYVFNPTAFEDDPDPRGTGANSIHLVDAADGTSTQTNFIPSPDGLFAADFEYHDGAFWIPENVSVSGALLRRFDPIANAITDTIELSVIELRGGSTIPDAITAVEFIGDTLYAGFSAIGNPEIDSRLGMIDTATGDVTFVGDGFGIGTPTGGLAYDGETLYTTNAGGNDASLYTVDPATGEATFVAEIRDVSGAPVRLTGLEFDGAGNLFGLGRSAFGDTLLSIDATTGIATVVGDIGSLADDLRGGSNLFNGLTFVPAPGAASVLGLAALGAVRRRRA